MTSVRRVIDAAIEGPIITSFSKAGYMIRKSLGDWRPIEEYDLTGKVVAITGPTSGLGLAATRQMAANGASIVMVARNPEKAASVRDEIASETGNDSLSTVIADMGNLEDVRAAASSIMGSCDRLDVLVHNAGALSNVRHTTPAGIEQTVAVQVVGPFLLTGLLLDLLDATERSRVLTMASGGMYAAGLTVRNLEMDETSYRGAEQYARAKRAQVTLNEMWPDRAPGTGIYFHALHPGWADTPGVASSLPTFRKVIGPLLRDPIEGADTLIWLAADDGPPLESNGGFWLDRQLRGIHKLPTTRRTDTPERREELWRWVGERSGLGVDYLAP